LEPELLGARACKSLVTSYPPSGLEAPVEERDFNTAESEGRHPWRETDGAPAAVRRQAFVRARLTQAPCPRPAQPSS